MYQVLLFKFRRHLSKGSIGKTKRMCRSVALIEWLPMPQRFNPLTKRGEILTFEKKTDENNTVLLKMVSGEG